jgi:hypothetical protein
VPKPASNDPLGDVANDPVQGLDLEQSTVGRAVVAGLRTLLLVTAGAEGLVARTGEGDGADLGAEPGLLEGLDQLVDGLGPEGVVAIWAIDGDPRQTVVHLVRDVSELGHAAFSHGRMVIPKAP